MELAVPTKAYEQSYRCYIDELGDEERYPFTLDIAFTDFSHLISLLDDYSQGINLPDYTVTNSTRWLVIDNEILGVTNIRHELNAAIKHCGGHIGLGIRPSCRGRGLGEQLMKLSIQFLIELGVTDIHIHCYKSNGASASIIKRSGGKLDSEIEVAGETVQRYIVATA